jgi:hypothetical protein
MWESKMFGRFKQKPAAEELKTTAETSIGEKPSKKPKCIQKPAQAAEDNILESTQTPTEVKATEKPFVAIEEYSSVSEIAKSIDHKLAVTKSTLGKYLRQLDDRRSVAEKSQRIYNLVSKIANTKPPKDASNEVDVNGLEIVLDATALNEVSAIEAVVRSQQQRLVALQQAREALQTLNQAGDTEGIRYLALEKEGIPEQILLKLQ